jgi:hypothetical protein
MALLCMIFSYMAKQDLTIHSITQAFTLLGERIGGYDEIEMLIVG